MRKKPRPRSIYDSDIFALTERGSHIRAMTEQFIKKIFQTENIIHPREFREVAELISGIATIESAMAILKWRKQFEGE